MWKVVNELAFQTARKLYKFYVFMDTIIYKTIIRLVLDPLHMTY
jgi:hypothetical protein